MDPKSDNPPQPPAEAQPVKRPATLGRMNITRMTPEELAARRKADEEEEARKREARSRPKSGPNAPAVTPAPPLSAPAAPSAPTAPETPMPEITAEVESPYIAAQGPILLQLVDAAVGLLGAEGKHLPALVGLASKLARELGAPAPALDLIPCAIQTLYIASQLDRRGPYAPPELATLQKLLGGNWEQLGPLVEPCAKGGLAKAKFERKEAAAIAAVVSLFNQTRNPAPTPQQTKMALATLRGQKFIPADALDALAAAISG
jgi:hypothetical protein